MPDLIFDDWESMIAAAESVVKTILIQDVAPVTESILRSHIKSDIYDVYTPKHNGWVTPNGEPTTYSRRHALEGAITSYLVDGGTSLLTTSTATASPSVVKGNSFRNRYDGSFLKLLESGNMGIWRDGFPRPAVKNAQYKIDNGKSVSSAIKRGIKREIGECYDI